MKLKLMTCITLVLTCICMAAISFADDEVSDQAYLVTRNDDGVNIYSSPDSSSAVVGRYVIGTVVDLKPCDVDGWQKIVKAGVEGYVQAKNATAFNANAPKTMGVVSIPDGELNLRAEKSLDSAITGRAANGVSVSILSESDGWYFVEFDRIYGYIMEKYLKVD